MIAAPDEDVVRLDVAMDEVGLVCGVERVGDGRQQAQDARGVQVTAAHELLEVGAAHDLHRDVQALALELACLVHRHDVGVVDARLDAGLALKAHAEALVGAQVGGQQLERDLPSQGELRGLVDDSHPPAPSRLSTR